MQTCAEHCEVTHWSHITLLCTLLRYWAYCALDCTLLISWQNSFCFHTEAELRSCLSLEWSKAGMNSSLRNTSITGRCLWCDDVFFLDGIERIARWNQGHHTWHLRFPFPSTILGHWERSETTHRKIRQHICVNISQTSDDKFPYFIVNISEKEV